METTGLRAGQFPMVRFSQGNSICSGFAVAAEGGKAVIVTANHCRSFGSPTVDFFTAEGKRSHTATGSVKRWNRQCDQCVVLVEAPFLAGFDLRSKCRTSPAVVGEKIAIVGFVHGTHYQRFEGTVIEVGRTTTIVQAWVESGQSGGIAIDAEGKAIGSIIGFNGRKNRVIVSNFSNLLKDW